MGKKYTVIGTYCKNKVFPDLKYLDITKKKAVYNIVKSESPDIIIHVAAIPSRRICENEPKIAFNINGNGTKNIINAANKCDSIVYYISSLAAIKHENQYGKTKLLGEKYTKGAKKGYNILRPSVIFGCSPNIQNDRPFNKIIRSLKKENSVTFDNSWKFPMTYIGDLIATIEFLMEKNIVNQVISVYIKEIKSMYEIASDILNPLGIFVKPDNSKEIVIESLPDMNKLQIPTSSYTEMIQKIIQEIKKNILSQI